MTHRDLLEPTKDVGRKSKATPTCRGTKNRQIRFLFDVELDREGVFGRMILIVLVSRKTANVNLYVTRTQIKHM